MSRRLHVLGLLTVLLLAGCGGSRSTSSTGSAAAQSTTSTTATSSSVTQPSSSRTTTTSTTTTKTTTAPGSARSSPPAPNGARIPATYKIGSGGALSPPTISAPSGFTVAVALANRDTKPHTVIIKTPSPSAPIHVPVGGVSHLPERKLPKGTYPITVDGAIRGALVIGSAPGP